MANYLGYEFIDAAEVIFFDENGECNAEITNEKMRERLEKLDAAVIPGFYGAYSRLTGKIASSCSTEAPI